MFDPLWLTEYIYRKRCFIEILKCIEHIDFPKTTVLVLIFFKKSTLGDFFLTSFDGDASFGVD